MITSYKIWIAVKIESVYYLWHLLVIKYKKTLKTICLRIGIILIQLANFLIKQVISLNKFLKYKIGVLKIIMKKS